MARTDRKNKNTETLRLLYQEQLFPPGASASVFGSGSPVDTLDRVADFEIGATHQRISTLGQGDGTSLEKQTETNLADAAYRNVHILDDYNITDVASGADPGRAGFMKLSGLVTRRTIQHVFVYDDDRLSRAPRHLLLFMPRRPDPCRCYDASRHLVSGTNGKVDSATNLHFSRTEEAAGLAHPAALGGAITMHDVHCHQPHRIKSSDSAAPTEVPRRLATSGSHRCRAFESRPETAHPFGGGLGLFRFPITPHASAEGGMPMANKNQGRHGPQKKLEPHRFEPRNAAPDRTEEFPEPVVSDDTASEMTLADIAEVADKSLVMDTGWYDSKGWNVRVVVLGGAPARHRRTWFQGRMGGK